MPMFLFMHHDLKVEIEAKTQFEALVMGYKLDKGCDNKFCEPSIVELVKKVS